MASVYTLRVKLFHQKKTYRDIEISGSNKLDILAEEIISAFGFDFDHAFGFYSNCSDSGYHDSPEKYELFADMEDAMPADKAKSVKKTAISKAFRTPGQKMLFLFDYGDDWMFEVEVRDIKEPEKGAAYPRIVKSSGKAPEQYPDEEDGENDTIPEELVEGSFGKKLGVFNKFMELINDNSDLSPEAQQEKIQKLLLEDLDGEMAEIERLEIEEEKTARPETKTEKKLVAFLEGNTPPDAKMLELWIEEKWENEERYNFPLFRRYARQQNRQLHALILFGLDRDPASMELMEDLLEFSAYHEDGNQAELSDYLVKACDTEEDEVLFEHFLAILCDEYGGDLPDELYAQMNESCKRNKKKHKVFKQIAGQDNVPVGKKLKLVNK